VLYIDLLFLVLHVHFFHIDSQNMPADPSHCNLKQHFCCY